MGNGFTAHPDEEQQRHVDGLEPGLFSGVDGAARRWASGVVDQNVQAAIVVDRSLKQVLYIRQAGKVPSHGQYIDAGHSADLRGGPVQLHGVAAAYNQVGAFLGQ